MRLRNLRVSRIRRLFSGATLPRRPRPRTLALPCLLKRSGIKFKTAVSQDVGHKIDG